VNLKEHTQLKELLDDIIECLCQIDESLAEEMAIPFSGGTADENVHGGADEPPGEGVLSDDVLDPLEEARVNTVRALGDVAECLDITEPHRKRYEGQRIAAKPAAERTPFESVRLKTQLTIDGKEEPVNGEVKKPSPRPRRFTRAKA